MGQITLSILVLIISQGALAVKGSCQESYVPEYTIDLLQEIDHWSMGGAFSSHARNAGVRFDSEAFIADCPDRAVFNFGRATATNCLEVDVLRGFASAIWVLDNYYRQSLDENSDNPVNFQEVYLEKAEEWGFLQYVEVINS